VKERNQNWINLTENKERLSLVNIKMNFRFSWKRENIFLTTAGVLASREGCCCMELVAYFDITQSRKSHFALPILAVVYWHFFQLFICCWIFLTVGNSGHLPVFSWITLAGLFRSRGYNHRGECWMPV
jgi:hypothetical protein